MKTVLAIKILLVSFKLITASRKWTTSVHGDNNVTVEIDCVKSIACSDQQNVCDINKITQFENSFKEVQISEEDTEFINEMKFKYWKNDSPFKKVEFGNEIILKSSWMVGKPLKLIVHGWAYASPGEPKAFCIKNAYLNSQEYNIITMDWSTIASSKYYFDVIRFSAQVGIILGHFLINLVKIYIVRPSDIHVIGHSIGAHVAGKSGKIFFNITKNKIDRITGLDPASPGFLNSWVCFWMPKERLDKEDATFVDVIHTETGIQGISEPIGHVDFYPNNGKSSQPGCEGFNVIEILHCSHSRAYVFYSESINNPSSFKSWKCNSMKNFNDEKCVKNVHNFMGHHANRDVQGVFYLKTNDKSPFGKVVN